jgi:hypothetical protein
MTETTSTAPPSAPPPGLLSRLVGIVFSPRETYTAVAARPRAFGALAVGTLLMAGAQFAFLSTEIGQDLALEQQIRSMEAFGMTVSDAQYTQMSSQMQYARYTSGASLLIFIPIVNAIVSGLLMVVFTMILGGAGTFRQVYAIVAHAGIIGVLQQLFGLPLTYASGELSGANLGVFVPMLEDDSLGYLFLSTIDLFLIWWCISLAIGLGVLYRRRTGPIATGLISLYVVIAFVVALIRS